jgi:hypothetical protein
VAILALAGCGSTSTTPSTNGEAAFKAEEAEYRRREVQTHREERSEEQERRREAQAQITTLAKLRASPSSSPQEASTGWSPSLRARYLSLCEADAHGQQGSDAVCACVLRYAEAQLPESRLAALKRMGRQEAEVEGARLDEGISRACG